MIRFRSLYLLVILMALPATHASRLPEQSVQALYGFQRQQSPYKEKDAEATAQTLKQLGCNAVFINGSDDRDFVLELQSHGIATYQEVTIFASKQLYEAHPEFRPIRSDGTEQPPREWYHGLCPNKPELRETGLKKVRELFQKSEVQGVWLDFIRYPIRWEVADPWIDDTCFCDDCLQAYRQYLNEKIILPIAQFAGKKELANWILQNHLPSWIDFKCAGIERFVADAARIRDEVRPDGVLGIFTVPWYLTDYNGAIQQTVAQDFSRLGRHVDVFSPMTYHLLCHRPADWVAQYTEWLRNYTQKPVWPIVQSFNEPSVLSADDFQKVVIDGAKASGSGIIVFSAGHIEKEQRWDQLQSAFQRIQNENAVP